MEDKKTLTSRQKGYIAAGAAVLVLLGCLLYLAFGGSNPPADYTGLWESHDKRWVYVEKGEKAEDFSGAVTGLVDKTEATYYVNKGEVDLSYNGLGASEDGWVYFTKGVLDRTFTGFAEADGIWYWVKDGGVDLTYTGAKEGTIMGDTSWWCVKDGVVDFTQDGPVITKKGVWYFKGGKLDTTYSGIKKLEDTWYYFTKGRQDMKYVGYATNDFGIWYIQNGVVDFNYNGKVKINGRDYSVTDGKVGNGKTVYLTFDDGPGIYTEDLLKILDHHKVKVTFFTTGFFKKNLNCLEKEAKAGHTVAVHTYTHDYAKVYKSTKAYWDDFEQMEKIIEEHTGKRTNLFRFPGGSSNGISRKYCEGIMTDLTREAEEKGLVYFDWNVLSGDAGDTKDSDKIYKNIVNGCKQHTHNVVLCHDIHDFTVGAMDKTIAKLLKQGYVLLPLNENSPTCHQHVNN